MKTNIFILWRNKWFISLNWKEKSEIIVYEYKNFINKKHKGRKNGFNHRATGSTGIIYEVRLLEKLKENRKLVICFQRKKLVSIIYMEFFS